MGKDERRGWRVMGQVAWRCETGVRFISTVETRGLLGMAMVRIEANKRVGIPLKKGPTFRYLPTCTK